MLGYRSMLTAALFTPVLHTLLLAISSCLTTEPSSKYPCCHIPLPVTVDISPLGSQASV